MARKHNEEMRNFILHKVRDHPGDIGPLASKKFGVSRATAGNYLRKLVSEGLLTASGQTNARIYALKLMVEVTKRIPINKETQEDVVWRELIAPHVSKIKPNVADICYYGFTEMLNNVKDHSGSGTCSVAYTQDAVEIEIWVRDYGIGIFEKIRKEFNLLDRRHALLELSKGKLTSDKANHTGEGIFFTSRLFDKFTLASNDLMLIRTQKLGGDWLVEAEDREDDDQGTSVVMHISLDAARTQQGIFKKYVDDESRFAKTVIPFTLAKYEGEQLVSRSQAKRIMMRAEKFSEIVLDFNKIQTIGQPFADEIFRVFQKEHPNTRLTPIHTTQEVKSMIAHAHANAETST